MKELIFAAMISSSSAFSHPFDKYVEDESIREDKIEIISEKMDDILNLLNRILEAEYEIMHDLKARHAYEYQEHFNG